MGLASNAPVTLTVITNVIDSNARSFSIKITQIDCLSYSRGTYYHITFFHCVTFLRPLHNSRILLRKVGFIKLYTMKD